MPDAPENPSPDAEAGTEARPPVFVQPERLGASTAPVDGPPHWQVAPLRRRAVASLIDIAVVVGFTVLLSAPDTAFYGPAEPFSDQAGWNATITGASTSTDLLISALESLIMWVVWTVYLGAMTARRGPENGQTLGKLMLGLRVRLADGAPVPPATAWRRALPVPALLSAPTLVAFALDGLLGTTPTISDGTYVLEYLAVGAILLVAVRSGRRATPYDERLGTVVVMSHPIWGRAETAIIRNAVERDERLPVEGRRRLASTWWLAAAAFAGLLYAVIARLWPGLVG